MTKEPTRRASGACGLPAIPQLADLPPGILQDLEAACRVIRVEAGQTVFHAGDTPEFVGCVREGCLRMQKTLADGRQHIVGLLVEGDMFGRVHEAPLHFEIEAATDAVVCAFRHRAFEDLLLRSPELERVVILNIINELDRARDWMIILSNQKITARLAGFLLVLCTRFAEIDHVVAMENGQIDIRIPINRADLAHLLGARPESISRGFQALAKAGRIDLLRPNLIRVLDFDGLAADAGDGEIASRVNLQHLISHARRRA